jgi:uncharacterized protein YbcV (DUF1398 family)
MNADIIAECMTLSFANTPFPAVVQKLAGAGVHAYTADLVALRTTYYGETREALDKKLPLETGPAIPQHFDATGVEQTVRAVQRGDIGYAEFLRRIMTAGCASYRVFIDGRKAMYFGRNGEFLTEPFPAPKN